MCLGHVLLEQNFTALFKADTLFFFFKLDHETGGLGQLRNH